MSGSPITPNALAGALLRGLSETQHHMSVLAHHALEEALMHASTDANRARRMRPGLRRFVAVRRTQKALLRAQVAYANSSITRFQTRHAGTVTIRKADQ